MDIFLHPRIYLSDATRPDKHGRFVLRYLVKSDATEKYRTLEKSNFTRYQNNSVMFNFTISVYELNDGPGSDDIHARIRRDSDVRLLKISLVFFLPFFIVLSVSTTFSAKQKII